MLYMELHVATQSDPGTQTACILRVVCKISQSLWYHATGGAKMCCRRRQVHHSPHLRQPILSINPHFGTQHPLCCVVDTMSYQDEILQLIHDLDSE